MIPAQRTVRRYGWTPDLPDQRDLFFLEAPTLRLPSAVDLRPGCPPVYDQGQLGSCTANAIAGALECAQIAQHLDPIFNPSRLFIYYNERVIEGTVHEDAGAMLRDGLKSVGKQGAPPEVLWPYVIKHFQAKPPAKVYRAAAAHPAILYRRLVPTIEQLQGCLAAGHPFVFGFTVYASFESAAVARSGVVPMPAQHESAIGGHAVLCVGYDDATGCFLVRNSWGASWGLAGYCVMPYGYLKDPNLADDFWTVTLVK